MAVDLLREIVLRWDKPEPQHVSLFEQAGITAVIPDSADEAFRNACVQAKIHIIPADTLDTVPMAQFGSVAAGKSAVLSDGLWPGITQPGVRGDPDWVASASRDPWVDANGYLVACLRALYPTRPPLLGYAAPAKEEKLIPFHSHELALMEAWVSGGNYLLSVEPRFRAALLKKDPKAEAAWKNLGRTARWLRSNQAMFQGQVMPRITALIDEHEASIELVNLMYRRNVSPRLASVNQIPPPDPACLEVVAADVKAMEGPARAKVLAHAQAGAKVVMTVKPDPKWTKLKSDEDRDIYQVGRGEVIAYREAIADPSEFALDVIDVISHRNRAVRLWNANSAIAVANMLPAKAGAKAQMVAINYGSPASDVQVRIQGNYASATLLRPESAPAPLKASKRGTTTEIYLPELNQLAVVQFT